MNRIIEQQFQVRYHYPVVFTADVADPANPALRDVLRRGTAGSEPVRLVVVIDGGVAAAFPSLGERLAAYLRHHLADALLADEPVIVPGGEALKSNRPAVEALIRRFADARLDRHGFVLAIGGGAVLDAVGYAASLVHRGVRLVRLPTTVLSQNDGGVGVKTAINDPAGKNYLGTFAPPFAVINDRMFLPALPDAEWRAGIAEAFKVAMIKDAAFFDWLVRHAAALAARDADAMDTLIYRCAALHLQHIRESGDPFEFGRARPLDFGHWSAHQLERMTGYRLGHGAAVAIGILLDTEYAVRLGRLPPAAADALHDGLAAAGFALWDAALARRLPDGRLEVLLGLAAFREHLGGALSITLPTAIGACADVADMDEAHLTAAVASLHQRALARAS